MIEPKSAPDAALEAQLLSTARWGWTETLIWLVAAALFFLVPTRLALLTEIATLGLLALSIDLVLGYAGIVTLGQGAFFGLGAYAAGLAAKWGGGSFPLSDPILGLVFAGAIAAALGWITSFLVLRGSDLTRLMVTLGVALIFAEIANRARPLTGGTDGLQGVNSSPVLGLFDFDLYGRTGYVYSLAVLFILFVVARRVVFSPFGLSLKAIKSNSMRAAAVGVPVHARLIAIYTMGAAYAGIAGALLAQTTQSASTDMIAFHRSADGLLILVFGGTGSLYGGLIGAVVFRLLEEFLGNVTLQYWEFWLGLALVLLVLFVRDGLIGLLRACAGRLRRREPGARP
jgi:branched-chain amino acid transport system permease protein